MIIDPSIFREPSAKEKKLFRETLRTLQLTPFVHEKQLTTSYPTSDRTSKATDEEASSAVPVDRALLSMKDKREQAAGKRTLSRIGLYAKILKNWHPQTGLSSWCWHLANSKLIMTTITTIDLFLFNRRRLLARLGFLISTR